MNLLNNPNPIQFSEDEQKHIDTITNDYIDILTKFAKSKARANIGSKTIKEWNIPILRFGNKEPTPYKVILKTTTKQDPHYFFSVWKGLHSPSKKEITLWSSGNVKKSDVGKYFIAPRNARLAQNEIEFFLTTLLHEMAHAKDPIGKMGTSGLSQALKDKSEKVDGWTLYINDAERKEIRAHLVEWELFIKNLAKRFREPKDDWEKKELSRDLYYLLIKGDSETLDKFLTGEVSYLTIKLPYPLQAKFNAYKDFAKLEDEALDKYIDFFTKKYKKKYKKKPSKKTINRWKKQRESNYTDMLDAIYGLFVKYGLTNPYQYMLWRSSKKGRYKRLERIDQLREKRSMVLLKRDKIVIQSLMTRFENLEK